MALTTEEIIYKYSDKMSQVITQTLHKTIIKLDYDMSKVLLFILIFYSEDYKKVGNNRMMLRLDMLGYGTPFLKSFLLDIYENMLFKKIIYNPVETGEYIYYTLHINYYKVFSDNFT